MNMYYSSEYIPKQSFGGKADGLISLLEKGFNVPDFYIIPNDTIQRIISKNETIVSLCNEWTKNVHPDKESLWAVRSSADVEDGTNKSYAGIFTTVINCKPYQLWDAFKKVIDRFKQVQKDIPEYHKTGNFGFNIVLQEMICGELSGVGFSVNPLEQISEHPIINITPGLGVKLVSGEENAMMIKLALQPEILSDDEHYHSERYESNEYKQITLTKDKLFEKVTPYLKELRKNLVEIELFQGHAIDTEFTIYNNKIYWLQVRPITTLIPRGARIVWDNSNMDVNYPGVVMPLTVSFVKHSYSNAYIHMCRFLGGSYSFIKKNFSLFENTIDAIQGGMYYNITAYQQLLYQMPFGDKASKLFPKMLGAEDTVFKKPLQSASKIAYVRLFFNILHSLLFFRYYKKKYITQYSKTKEGFDKTSVDKYSHTELTQYYNTLETKLSSYWYVPILNSLFTMISYNSLEKIISRSRLYQEYPNFLNDSLMGSGQVVSMEIVQALQDLTRRLHQDSMVKKIIIEKESTLVLPYLKEHYPTYYSLIASYIQKYGERSDEGELKIETINYREDPTKFVDFLKSNLSVSTHLIRTKEKVNFISILKEKYTTNPIKFLLLKTGIQFIIKRVRDRENFRFIRTKTFDMVRQVFREMDRKLFEDNAILSIGDSLYLSFEELMYPDVYALNYKKIIEERKSIYETYKNIEHPIRYYEINNELYPIEEKTATSKNELDGVACSSGVTEGEVLLVTAYNIHELEITGKILVAPFFEPGWVGLFSRAQGIISERGSLLSHTSILCREMGIPAIIKAKRSTKNLRNGDIIKMNGATGSVEKINQV